MKKAIILSAFSLLWTLSGVVLPNTANLSVHKLKTEIKKTKQEKNQPERKGKLCENQISTNKPMTK
ncbi:MAG: hypothetical protein ABIR66_01670 [Saprospiraceae bacterium]